MKTKLLKPSMEDRLNRIASHERSLVKAQPLRRPRGPVRRIYLTSERAVERLHAMLDAGGFVARWGSTSYDLHTDATRSEIARMIDEVETAYRLNVGGADT